jgi:RNA polymerase sigma-70 factor (ECF subfamily)
MISRKSLPVAERDDRELHQSGSSYADIKAMRDEALMELIKRGNHDAFAQLFDRYYRLVLSIAVRILRNRPEAEDLMQDVFFEIYRKGENYDPARGSAKSWIMRFAYSRSLNRLEYLTSRQFYNAPAVTDLHVLRHTEQLPTWNGLTADEWSKIIQEGLATLNEKQRDTLYLACTKGHSLKEISSLTNETLGNTRHYYYRGIKKLRQYLQDRACFQESLARVQGEA